MRRTGGLVLAAGALLLALVWLLAPPHSPPLYDGISGPISPYRYLNPPAGLGPQHHNPTTLQQTVTLSSSTSPEEYIYTKEATPQAILALAQGALRLPAGTRQVTFTVRPVKPPAPLPSGTLDGNVYLFSATANGRSLPLIPNVGARVSLRKTGSEAAATIEQYTGGQWVQRPTNIFVNLAYFSTNARSLGYYALVINPGSASSSRSYVPYIIIAIIVVLLILLGLIALRLMRSGGAVSEEE
jgi:hypothetical protein